MATRYQKKQITETVPDWTATGKEPPSSLRSQGFLSGYKPPAAYFNWFWTKVSTLFGELVTVINKIQDYLNDKRFYIRQDIGYISTVGYLISFLNQYAAMDEPVILSFIVDAWLFSNFGVERYDKGELNCKTKVVTFPNKGITLFYNGKTFVKVESPISDRSISTNKIDATLHTAAYCGEIGTIADLSDAIDTNESANDDAVILYFDVGVGSLKSITHNSAFGMYYYQNGMLIFDNGYIFTFEDGVLTQKTLIDASAIADGTITKQKLSEELKAELGLK